MANWIAVTIGWLFGRWMRDRRMDRARVEKVNEARSSSAAPFEVSILDHLPAELSPMGVVGLKQSFVATTLSRDAAEKIYMKALGADWVSENVTRAPVDEVAIKPEPRRLYLDVHTYGPQVLFEFLVAQTSGGFMPSAHARIQRFAERLADKDPWTECGGAAWA